jgi:hypothetical protein
MAMRRGWNGDPLPGRLVGSYVRWASLSSLPPATVREARRLPSFYDLVPLKRLYSHRCRACRKLVRRYLRWLTTADLVSVSRSELCSTRYYERLSETRACPRHTRYRPRPRNKDAYLALAVLREGGNPEAQPETEQGRAQWAYRGRGRKEERARTLASLCALTTPAS